MGGKVPYYACYRLIQADDEREIGGTCLIVRHKESLYLVTARHCVDRKYVDPRASVDRPKTLRIHGFGHLAPNEYAPSAGMHLEVRDWTFGASDNDVAVARIDGFSETPIYLWDSELFRKSYGTIINIGTEVVFSGYPEEIESENDRFPSLILRKGVVASHVGSKVRVPGALGNDYYLIDAFSQNGFSGAPIFALVYRELDLQRALIDFGESLGHSGLSFFGAERIFVLSSPVHVFLGLNCGHFKTRNDRSNGVHSGLSYYVGANSVYSAIKECAKANQLSTYVTVGDSRKPVRNAMERPAE